MARKSDNVTLKTCLSNVGFDYSLKIFKWKMFKQIADISSVFGQFFLKIFTRILQSWCPYVCTAIISLLHCLHCNTLNNTVVFAREYILTDTNIQRHIAFCEQQTNRGTETTITMITMMKKKEIQMHYN